MMTQFIVLTAILSVLSSASSAPTIFRFAEDATRRSQIYTVPPNTTRILVQIWGAGGGGSYSKNKLTRGYTRAKGIVKASFWNMQRDGTWHNSQDGEHAATRPIDAWRTMEGVLSWHGGPGGYIAGVIAVSPGEVLTVQVGQGGAVDAYPAGTCASLPNVPAALQGEPCVDASWCLTNADGFPDRCAGPWLDFEEPDKRDFCDAYVATRTRAWPHGGLPGSRRPELVTPRLYSQTSRLHFGAGGGGGRSAVLDANGKFLLVAGAGGGAGAAGGTEADVAAGGAGGGAAGGDAGRPPRGPPPCVSAVHVVFKFKLIKLIKLI